MWCGKWASMMPSQMATQSNSESEDTKQYISLFHFLKMCKNRCMIFISVTKDLGALIEYIHILKS